MIFRKGTIEKNQTDPVWTIASAKRRRRLFLRCAACRHIGDASRIRINLNYTEQRKKLFGAIDDCWSCRRCRTTFTGSSLEGWRFADVKSRNPLMKYLLAVESMLEAEIASGANVGESIQIRPPRRYRGWSGNAYVVQWEINFSRRWRDAQCTLRLKTVGGDGDGNDDDVVLIENGCATEFAGNVSPADVAEVIRKRIFSLPKR